MATDSKAQSMIRPTVFIGSSSEAKNRSIVPKLVREMSEHFDVRPWYSVFDPGRYTMGVLMDEVDRADAALLIFTKDDAREFRGDRTLSARDNVVLEYGFFAARLTTARVWIFEEEGVGLPSDVLGLTTYRFRSEQGPAQDADITLCVDRMRKAWKPLPKRSRSGTGIDDGGLGFASTLNKQRATLTKLIENLATYSRESTPALQQPVSLDSSSAAISAYCEALDRVEERFWTTTLLSSGFWTQREAAILEANARMMRRLQNSKEQARRLFLVDQEPYHVAQSYKMTRIHLRQLDKEDEIRRFDSEFENLRRSIKRLLREGCDVRVAFDRNQILESLPSEMLSDPFDSELAIYDSFRVDVFEGGRKGRIAHVKSFTSAVRNYDGYLAHAEQYFEDLWEAAEPIESFLEDLQRAMESATTRIDYTTNWLAIYEFALDQEDEELKTVEIKRIAEMLRERELWGKIDRYLDIGTCTARYPIRLRDAVTDKGEIIGIDEDFDCVRFAISNVERQCSDDSRISIQHTDFSSHDTGIHGKFDLITCTLGTLSHFGWDRNASFSDRLQRALNHMRELLHDDGLLILGTWSRFACEREALLRIYSDSDRKRLTSWTPPPQELRERLARAGLRITNQVQPDIRLDLLVCEAALG